MKKGILALLVVLVVGLIATAAVSAYRGDPELQGPNFDLEIHEQLEAAMESGDYNTWIAVREANNLPMNGRMFSVVNEDNFDLFVQMHEANELGDYETAANIRAELGLGSGRGMGNHYNEDFMQEPRKGMGGMHKQGQEPRDCLYGQI